MNYTIFKSHNKDKFVSQNKKNEDSNMNECLWENSPFRIQSIKPNIINTLWSKEIPKLLNITDNFNFLDIIHYNKNEGL